MATVTIIGAGMMGSALAFPAAENGHKVKIVGTHLDREIIDAGRRENKHPKFDREFPSGVEFYQIEELPSALIDADVVIGGVSSFGVDWFAEEILPVMPDGITVLTVTKGLIDTEDGRLLTYPDIWQKKLDELGKNISLNAVGGPCTSYELVAHDQTEVAFCGKNIERLKYLRDILQTDYYHISVTTDVTGIESAVALKNGYALGIALTIGINRKNFGNDRLHFNSQAAVFGQAAKEMYRLLEFQNALTLDNLCVGVGDLYVTVYGGRTRLIGILLGEGLSVDKAKEELRGVTLESLVVAERVGRAVKRNIEKGILKAEDFPLLLHIDGILNEGKKAELPWDSFRFESDEKYFGEKKYWKQSKENIYVSAHRGWRSHYPENTLPAFEAAIALDVDQIEFDVRVTKDGELVIMHDATLERTTNGEGLVCDKTLAEIKQLDAGSYMGEQFAGTQVPTLIEVMELIKDHPTLTVDVEIKEYPTTPGNETRAYEVCDRVLAIIDKYGFTDRVVINTFSNPLNEYIFKKHGRKYRQHVYYPLKKMKGEVTLNPYEYSYCTCMFKSMDSEISIATKAEFDIVESFGGQAWAGAGIKTADGVDLAIKNGATLITCDNPEEILGLLRDRGYHK